MGAHCNKRLPVEEDDDVILVSETKRPKQERVYCPISPQSVTLEKINDHLDLAHSNIDADPTEPFDTPSSSSSYSTAQSNNSLDEAVADSGLRLLRIQNLSDRKNRACPSLEEILSMNGPLERMLQLTFNIELDWFMKQIPADSKDVPVDIIYGSKDGNGNPHRWKNLKLVQIYRESWGCHHTKMMILHFQDDTLRLVIHSANLSCREWNNTNQGLWISPPLSRKTFGQEASRFENDLSAYLQAYFQIEHAPSRLQAKHYLKWLEEWVKIIQLYDLSPCRAVIIASIPGKHTDDDLEDWGIMRMAKVLQEVKCEAKGTIICQFSSLGGGEDATWTTDIFHKAMSQSTKLRCGLTAMPDSRLPDLALVYPTESEIKQW
ncbi:hypothetical protein SmJEL517_g04711 [Synchytrium microbalum]|uniref:Tyrosyl-DNA phosphodiesterase n=1 Tax=Synchytrium microbalum TaxID=1806994 RepID=A0A507BZ62_9FUNG|nr:uncharacterized protein SmJEL517_g04711 [Synchytrium microbalum]TPX32159.1 hypothetical protein SmJEL517_g04711 [Synchytrium microbalum]